MYYYNTVANCLDPKFTLDFKGRPWKIHSYGELLNHFIGDITIEKKLTETTSTTEYPAKFIVDKHTLKGTFYKIHNDYLGDIPLEWPTFYNGYYVWNVDPGDLIDQLDAQLKNNIAYVQRGSLNFRSPCAILQLTGFAASGIFANEFSSCPESQVLVNQI